MMQRTANENAACVRRICKRPDRITNNDARHHCLLFVLILKQHQIFKIPISINFTNPLRKTIYLQIYLKITKKLQNGSKHRYVG